MQFFEHCSKRLWPPHPPPPSFWTFGRFFLTYWEPLCTPLRLGKRRHRSEDTMSNIPYNLNNSTLKEFFCVNLSKIYANPMSILCQNAITKFFFFNMGLTPSPFWTMFKSAQSVERDIPNWGPCCKKWKIYKWSQIVAPNSVFGVIAVFAGL